VIPNPASIRRGAAALVAVAAAAFLPASVGASSATTQPQTIYKVTVVLKNGAISLKPAVVRRGALVLFRVRNASTKPTDFFIGGVILHKVKPSAVRSFQLQFLNRGKFLYYSMSHPGSKIRGSFVVT
jgi:plastocyanin